MTEKYDVSTLSVETILGYIKSGEIAIPEIQRPFVWKPKQVRDLIDSLYTGYPTGYLIISQNPDMKLKDGSLSVGKKVMIAIPKGTKVKNFGYYTSVLGTKWLYIQFTYNNITYTGFASGKYLAK
jgi:hypothetical protein